MDAIVHATLGDELVTSMTAVRSALQKRATVSGMRAYMAVLRKQAAADSPFATFRKASAYRGSVKGTTDGGARGTLASGGFGNILEAGARGHWAPLDPTQNTPMTAGLRAWLTTNAPQVLAARQGLPFIYLAARAGRPWVVPSQASADSEATGAFEEAAFKALEEAR